THNRLVAGSSPAGPTARRCSADSGNRSCSTKLLASDRVAPRHLYYAKRFRAFVAHDFERAEISASGLEEGAKCDDDEAQDRDTQGVARGAAQVARGGEGAHAQRR